MSPESWKLELREKWHPSRIPSLKSAERKAPWFATSSTAVAPHEQSAGSRVLWLWQPPSPLPWCTPGILKSSPALAGTPSHKDPSKAAPAGQAARDCSGRDEVLPAQRGEWALSAQLGPPSSQLKLPSVAAQSCLQQRQDGFYSNSESSVLTSCQYMVSTMGGRLPRAPLQPPVPPSHLTASRRLTLGQLLNSLISLQWISLRVFLGENLLRSLLARKRSHARESMAEVAFWSCYSKPFITSNRMKVLIFIFLENKPLTSPIYLVTSWWHL